MCNLYVLRYPVILLTLLCASCGTALPSISPYKLEVQQGNVVTSKMLLQLRPGMTQSQVRFIMGTPLIQDSFHGKRWDYVYQMREKGKITEQRRVILDFENELLKTVHGDVVPSGADLAKANEDAANIGTRVISPSAKSEGKGLLAKLKFWEKDEAQLAEEAAAVKAKTETSEAAKRAADLLKENAAQERLAKEKMTQDSVAKEHAAPLVEAKPILAAPDLPVTETPAIAADVPLVVAPSDAVVPVTGAVKVELAPTKAVAANPEQAVIVVKASELEPLTPNAYDSSSGMKFDRTLRLAPEDVAPTVQPEVIVPRAGNKTIPKPKDLPAESVPSFFDRMLEKIGF
ncbi:MAG: outer membrane protein assembly factor BamE [Methylotenera sp.]|nr:outer membrane protein assembly factor BamE [Methylotenera sp.]MSP99617.1 outer membrane protein assembly factor BamE [Methylotenera sp.]